MATIKATRPGEFAGSMTMEVEKSTPCNLGNLVLDPEACAFYRRAMEALDAARVPFLVGGAFALERYTGITRYTKDFDVFVRPRNTTLALATLEEAGYRTELTFPHWLGKAYCGDL